MKILYVATLVSGFEDILEGKEDSRGLPSFILPLKALLEEGNHVDIILISNYKKDINIQVSWIKKENIIANINNDLTRRTLLSRIIYKAKSAWELWISVDKALRLQDYDLVYCHGKAAVIGNIAANIRKIPCAYRLYGSVHLYDSLKKNGSLKSAIKNPIYYFIFKLDKHLLLATDEGSHTDYVFDIWRPKKDSYSFYHWINGVDIEKIKDLEQYGEVPEYPYLLMAGRIDRIKNQASALYMLQGLQNQHIYIHILFIGHVSDKCYKSELEQLIIKLGLQSYVHFLDAVPRPYMKKLSYYSKATIIWDDFSQKGNVFFETFSTGAIILSRNDGSLNDYVKRDINFFLADDIESAIVRLSKIINFTDEERHTVQLNAIQAAEQLFLSWDKRVAREIELLKQIALGESIL